MDVPGARRLRELESAEESLTMVPVDVSTPSAMVSAPAQIPADLPSKAAKPSKSKGSVAKESKPASA